MCRKCYKPSQKKAVSKMKKIRQRFVEEDATFGGKPCLKVDGKTALTVEDGSEMEQQACQPDKDVPPCPAKAGAASFWSSWSEWEVCPATCKKPGLQTRRRNCNKVSNSSKGCNGKAREEQTCESICPPDGWTEWDQWSHCAKTCGKGQEARKRTCLDDHREDIPKEEKTCKGIQRETRVCDSGSCSKVEHIKTVGNDPTGMSEGSNPSYAKEKEEETKAGKKQEDATMSKKKQGQKKKEGGGGDKKPESYRVVQQDPFSKNSRMQAIEDQPGNSLLLPFETWKSAGEGSRAAGAVSL